MKVNSRTYRVLNDLLRYVVPVLRITVTRRSRLLLLLRSSPLHLDVVELEVWVKDYDEYK